MLYADIGTLRKVIGDAANETNKSIEKVIDASLLVENAKREPRSTDWIHVSNLVDPCFRWEVFRRVAPAYKVAPSTHNAKSLRIFKMGRAIERFFRDQVLGPARLLLGDWACSVCNRRIFGTLPEQACSCAAWARWEYEEAELKDETWKVIGHRDAAIWWADKKLPLEIKSIRPKSGDGDTGGWENLTAPMFSHADQLNTYMWMGKDEEGLVAYINKSTGQIKWFRVQYNPERIEQHKERIVQMRKAIAAGDPYLVSRCDGCGKITWSRASACPAKNPCFAAKELTTEELASLQP